MSLYATITWGIVSGFVILEAIEMFIDYVEDYFRSRRIHKLLDQLDDAWDDLEENKPTRKQAAKKTVKRK